jgi:PIN domain
VPALPLLVFDTNVLLDVLLHRDGDQAVLLMGLAGRHQVELIVPRYVLLEFRGIALRWIRQERERVEQVRRSANGWQRCAHLGVAAEDVRGAAALVEDQLSQFAPQIDEVIHQVERLARVPEHTPDLHFRGELRHLSGRPPDRPGEGLSDCRIYEALLEIAREQSTSTRRKFFVTRDSDFDVPELVEELSGLGFEIHKDPGRLYGELR